MIVSMSNSSVVDFPRTKERVRGKSRKEIISISRAYVRRICPDLSGPEVEVQVRLLSNPLLLDNGYRLTM